MDSFFSSFIWFYILLIKRLFHYFFQIISQIGRLIDVFAIVAYQFVVKFNPFGGFQIPATFVDKKVNSIDIV